MSAKFLAIGARIWHERKTVFRDSAGPWRIPILAFLGCTVASAQPNHRFELTWQAPTGCPEPSEVSREIVELVAASSVPPLRSAILAQAAVTADDGGFSLRLTIRDNDGVYERKLDAPSCSEIAHAAALIVALAIDPTLLVTPSGPGGNVTNAVPSGPMPPASNAPQTPVLMSAPGYVPPPTLTPARAESSVPLFWRVGLVEFLGIKTFPGAHLGTGLFGGIQSGAWRLDATVSELSADVKSGIPGKVAKFSLYRFGARGCWLTTRASFAIGPCLGAEAGVLHGAGYGVSEPGEGSSAWLAATAGALFDWRLGASSVLGFVGEAELPWRSRNYNYFTFLGNPDFYRPPHVAGRIGLSLSAGWR